MPLLVETVTVKKGARLIIGQLLYKRAGVFRLEGLALTGLGVYIRVYSCLCYAPSAACLCTASPVHRQGTKGRAWRVRYRNLLCPTWLGLALWAS